MKIIDCALDIDGLQDPPLSSLNIEALQSTIAFSKRIGFNWQDSFLSEGHIDITHPIEGHKITLTRPIVTSWNTMFLDAGNDSQAALVISHLGVGYLISGIYLITQDIFLSWGNIEFGAQSSDFEIYLRISHKRSQLGIKSENTGRFSVLLGEENFAHFLHNEISGLMRICSNSEISQKLDKLYVLNEPLGPLETIFPSLQRFQKNRIGWRDPEDIYVNENLIHLGGVRLSATERERVINYVHERQSRMNAHFFAEWSQKDAPCLLLGLRSHSRVVRGLEDAYIELVKIMLDRFGKIRLILDGFSLPVDHNYDLRYPSYMIEAAKNSKAKSEHFCSKVADLGDVKTICTADHDVATAIWLASKADYYFTNLGTQQHKVGWFSNASGVIHGSPQFLKDEQLNWFNYLVEGSRPVKKLPDELYEISVDHVKPNMEKYSFTDPKAVANWVYQATIVEG